MTHDKTRRRIDAAKHYDKHGIDETGGEEVEVAVETPLSVILPIHLDPERYAKLKRLAKKRNMPITSMAILTEALDEP